VCDQFKAQVTESTKRLATKLKMHLAVIPGGLTSQLQPLDISVNKPFKGLMHEEWEKWIEAPTHHVTPAGRVKWPSISNVISSHGKKAVALHCLGSTVTMFFMWDSSEI
jgi:hypothetical protein